MESFNSLPRQKRRNLLRQLARKSLLEYGIQNAILNFISDTTNTIFRVQTQNTKYILRIDPEPATETRSRYLEEELIWLARLNQDTTLLVPKPIFSINATTVQLVVTPSIPEGKLVTLLHWMPGKLVGERVSPNVMQQLGETTAILHKHTDRFSLPEGSVRTHIDWEKKLSFLQDNTIDMSLMLSSKDRDICAETVNSLLIDISSVKQKDNYGLIHADLHHYNCLLHEKKLMLIDFHDCCIGSYFYDIGVPLSYLDEYSNYDKLKKIIF